MTAPEYAKPDLLRGAEEIAEYVYGDPALKGRIYDLYRRVRYPHRFPIYKLGGELVARRSEIEAWFAAQRENTNDNDDHKGHAA